MKRLSCITAAGVFLLVAALPAEEPTKASPPLKPPWQRSLGFFDALKAVQQGKQLAELQEAGKFADALKVAESLAELFGRVQGKDHWEAVNARWKVETIRRVMQQGEGARKDYIGIAALKRRADTLVAKGRYKEAQPLLKKILAIRRQVLSEEHPDTARSYNDLAYSLKAQGKYVEAEQDYLKALAVFSKVLGEEHPDTATSYNNLATSLEAQGKYAEAEKGFRTALAIRCKVLGEQHDDTATSYSNVAVNLSQQGKYEEAEKGLRKALAIHRKLLGEQHPSTARSYDNLAYNLNAQSKYAEAEKGCRTALAIRCKLLGEEHPDTAISYNNVAMNLNAQGKYAEAETGLRKALAIKRKVLGEQHPSTAIGYNNLADNLDAQGKYTEAAEGFRTALAIYRTVLGEEHPDTANSYSGVAVNLDYQGKYAEAEQVYRKALAIRRKVLGEEHPQTAQSYENLAANLNDQSKAASASVYVGRALAINRKVLGEDHPYTAAAYNSVAYNLNAQGKYREAEEGYRKALAIYRKLLGEEHSSTALSYNNLASNLAWQGKHAEAEENYRKALAIRRKLLGEQHPDTALSYNNLAFNLNDQGRYAEAEKNWHCGAEAFAKARLHIAATGLERAAKTSEGSTLPRLAAVLARNGKPVEAWQRFEESLGRGTWDDLSARLRRTPAEQTRQSQLVVRLTCLDRLFEKTVTAKEPTVEQNRRRADLLTQRRQTQDELDAFSRRMEKQYGPVAGQIFDREKVQKALPADIALIGWLDLPGHPKAKDPDGEHWAVLLRSTGAPIWLRLRGSGTDDAWTSDDTRLPSDLLTALQSSAGKWQPLAQRLRKQRLDPLRKHLDGIKHLIVLPSMALAGVPIEVFADKFTIGYALSGTMYAYLHQQPKPTSNGLLALADPVFDPPSATPREEPLPKSGEWPPLPGTRIEVEGLRRLFGEAKPTLLTDSDASEQRLNELATSGALSKYRYLHLATHGEVDNVFPLRSAVILSRDKLPDAKQRLDLLLSGQTIPDGRLTAEEVLRRWNLNCDLVTLSACQTALGKYERGEGFVGFAQALILSGSRSVCLSLWKVDDTATALLMERFYQNLLGRRAGLKEPLSKSAALAEAKTWLRDLPREEAVKRAASLSEGVARGKGRPVLPLLPAVPPTLAKVKEDRPYEHPYYWAAFVLIGDRE